MFKRNKNQPNPRRPIDAKTNQRAFSYYANRSTTASSRGVTPEPAKSGFDWKLLPSLIALIAILVSVGYASLLDTNPRINKGDNKEAAVFQSDDAYQQSIQKLLQESIFSRSKVLIDTPGLEKKILEGFPELKSASITIPLTSRRPIVVIEPVQPALILKTNNRSYLVEASGRAVRELSERDYFTDLPIITDDSGMRVKVGEQVLPTAEVAFLRELNHQLVGSEFVAESINLPSVPNQADVRLNGEPYYIKFNLQGDARLQFGAFHSVKQRLETQRVKPAEYVDVRVEDKVFYK